MASVSRSRRASGSTRMLFHRGSRMISMSTPRLEPGPGVRRHGGFGVDHERDVHAAGGVARDAAGNPVLAGGLGFEVHGVVPVLRRELLGVGAADDGLVG